MISRRTIRHGTQDQPTQEEEEWPTQLTDRTTVFNWDSPTIVFLNVEPSSPDVSLASDHLSIIIRLHMKTPSNLDLRRIYVNQKKANWDRYIQEVEALSLNRLPER